MNTIAQRGTLFQFDRLEPFRAIFSNAPRRSWTALPIHFASIRMGAKRYDRFYEHFKRSR